MPATPTRAAVVAGTPPDGGGRRWLWSSLSRMAASSAVAPALSARDRLRGDPGAADPPVPPVGSVHTVTASDGARLHARVSGLHAGPTFVLTHGLACNHALWAYQARLLGEIGRVVTWDLRGHGASTGAVWPPARGRRVPASAMSTQRLATDLVEVTEALAVGPVIPVGHSLGGMVTLRALRDHPPLHARACAAVVIATPTADFARSVVPRGTLTHVEVVALRRLLRWLVGDPMTNRRFIADSGGRHRSYASVRVGGFGAAPSPTHVRAFRDAVAATAPAVRRATVTAMERTDLRGTLGEVTVPTLVVIGGRDRLVHPAQSAALAQELPRARPVVFERAGHAVVLERHAAITRRIALLAEQVLAGNGDLDRAASGRG